ncbi:MAG: hypothetical protein A3A57_01965 [Candidatus Woykebacteria bacterium RIFCSPLOWO2_01_FULL_41_12]|uniref:tRNA dimethylallyltransferase n=1 Tax=Candidatus Woykebacteria bacterium RIFCSPLOWO2_01_FULL_41_12 TaxID=1802604 RepID=A0A1G1WVL3_9BACT|nr:MAG: hypothetical protein A3A57_01965 [Candidatus Woykebacteria bacterium RIFCSPLOWO2_01_FULL_41_12]
MKRLLVIVGPTGTGKTNLALDLAKKFNGELVSADSRQIYKGMDIGTGKLPGNIESRMKNSDLEKHDKYWLVKGIPVHLYDVITPDERFSVAEYQQLAYKVIDEIHYKHKLPILVGGTGLYIQSVTEGLKIPNVPPNKRLRKNFEVKPLSSLISELEAVDPRTAEKIDKQNPRRVIRALEVFYQTGESMSKLKSKFKIDFDLLKIGLTSTRERLYKNANARVDNWFRGDFVKEVKNLIKSGYKESIGLSTLGYRQVAMYLESKISLEEAKQRTIFEHHGYIRRQSTWFKKTRNTHWFDIQEKNFKFEINKLITPWLKSV